MLIWICLLSQSIDVSFSSVRENAILSAVSAKHDTCELISKTKSKVGTVVGDSAAPRASPRLAGRRRSRPPAEGVHRSLKRPRVSKASVEIALIAVGCVRDRAVNKLLRHAAGGRVQVLHLTNEGYALLAIYRLAINLSCICIKHQLLLGFHTL